MQNGDKNLDYMVKTVDVINLKTGKATQGPPVPADTFTSCAAHHKGVVYWVRGAGTPEVYYANGELGESPSWNC